MIIFKEGVREI